MYRYSMRVLKIIIAGEGSVGKTTLLRRYIEGRFNEGTKLTIEVDFFTKQVVMGEKIYMLQFWDLGGQERFQFLHLDFIKESKAGLLVLDLANRFSLERVDSWVQKLRHYNSSLKILLACTKLDREQNILISDEEIAEVRSKHALVGSYKVSSKTDFKVNDLFYSLVEIASSELT